MPAYLNSLGGALSDRCGWTGEPEDLEETIRVYRRAMEETPVDSPDHPMYLNNLGGVLSDRFERTGRQEDLDEATGYFRRTCQLGAVSAPQVAIEAARRWRRWAFQRKQWAETTEAYGYGLAVGRQVLGQQIQRVQKEGVLRDLQEMSGPAAYTLAKLDRLKDAVAMAERDRARLLAEALQRNRRDLERLPALGHADLYERYREIALTQERLIQSATAAGPDKADHLSNQARLDAILAANADFDRLVNEILKIPGYADFPAEPTFAEIQATAQDAPLVYLLATSAGGLALIVDADDVQPIWLDELTDVTVREWLMGSADISKLGGWLGAYATYLDKRTQLTRNAWFATVDDIVRRLWSHVTGPVAAVMLKALPPEASSAPEATFVPGGLLALLPLHAAWTEDSATLTGRRYFLDEIAVRYAPSALALRHAREAIGRASVERLLAVEEPLAVHSTPLPNAHAEVAALADRFDFLLVLAGAQATRNAVRAALPQAQVVHFMPATTGRAL